MINTKAPPEQLVYAPVSHDKPAERGPLTQARENSWSPLGFQDFVKFN